MSAAESPSSRSAQARSARRRSPIVAFSLLERGSGDAGALVGAGDVTRERDDHGGVAGGHDFLEDVLEHHGWDLAGARQLVGLHEALEELGSGDVDAFGEFLVAEGDGHGDDLDAVVAGVVFLYVRRRINDDANGHNASQLGCFPPILSFACRCLVKSEERRVNCS